MRRIILGAIWLTGFLAVLLAWGMMYGRAQGEGPSRLIGIASDANNATCQMTTILPETGDHQAIGDRVTSCNIGSLGWAGGWFYYRTTFLNSTYDGATQVERVDAHLHHHQIVATNLSTPNIWLSPDGQYLFQQDAQTKNGSHFDIYRTSDGQQVANAISGILSGVFSPDGQWMVVRDDRTGQVNGYLVRVDGGAVMSIPDNGEYLASQDIVLWSDNPAWLVLLDHANDLTLFEGELYKMRPDGRNLTLISSSSTGITYSGWSYPSGMVGLLKGDVFEAMWVDTGAILWQLAGVATVYTGGDEWGQPRNLDADWVHFKMTDGRLARCRIDGSALTFYDPHGLPI